MKVKQYGKTSTDKKTTDALQAREIVREIIEFGVSEQQILKVCYLLSLEIESISTLKDISGCIKKYLDQISEKPSSGLITDI